MTASNPRECLCKPTCDCVNQYRAQYGITWCNDVRPSPYAPSGIELGRIDNEGGCPASSSCYGSPPA